MRSFMTIGGSERGDARLKDARGVQYQIIHNSDYGLLEVRDVSSMRVMYMFSDLFMPVKIIPGDVFKYKSSRFGWIVGKVHSILDNHYRLNYDIDGEEQFSTVPKSSPKLKFYHTKGYEPSGDFDIVTKNSLIGTGGLAYEVKFITSHADGSRRMSLFPFDGSSCMFDLTVDAGDEDRVNVLYNYPDYEWRSLSGSINDLPNPRVRNASGNTHEVPNNLREMSGMTRYGYCRAPLDITARYDRIYHNDWIIDMLREDRTSARGEVVRTWYRAWNNRWNYPNMDIMNLFVAVDNYNEAMREAPLVPSTPPPFNTTVAAPEPEDPEEDENEDLITDEEEAPSGLRFGWVDVGAPRNRVIVPNMNTEEREERVRQAAKTIWLHHILNE